MLLDTYLPGILEGLLKDPGFFNALRHSEAKHPEISYGFVCSDSFTVSCKISYGDAVAFMNLFGRDLHTSDQRSICRRKSLLDQIKIQAPADGRIWGVIGDDGVVLIQVMDKEDDILRISVIA